MKKFNSEAEKRIFLLKDTYHTLTLIGAQKRIPPKKNEICFKNNTKSLLYIHTTYVMKY